ncbi:hypothetical protein KAS08_05885 [Candidatus Pacearchaeota archaeon]|nr:hypothetical protein [Candidatus Pacearchaeota archaeon]
MPGKNKPKRLDRNTKWRVARRKRKISQRVNGNSRNRQPRPKHKGVIATVEEKVKAPTKEKVTKAEKKPVEEKATEDKK